jgi:hypothetical protein
VNIGIARRAAACGGAGARRRRLGQAELMAAVSSSGREQSRRGVSAWHAAEEGPRVLR